MTDFLELLLNGDQGLTPAPSTVLFSLLLAFLLGQFVGWIYMWTHTSLSYSRSFVGSLVVLPVIVAMMMILMTGSMMIAFGLLAVFAVVRFRNVLKDTRDTSFILWTIVEGMSAGTFRYTTSVIGVVCIGMVLLYLRWSNFGSRGRFDSMLSLQVSGDLASQFALLKDVLRRHTLRSALLNQQQTPDQRCLLRYRLLLRDPSRSAELRDELDAANDIDDVSIFRHEDESEV